MNNCRATLIIHRLIQEKGTLCVPECTCYKIVKSLVDDHHSVRPHQCDSEGGRKRVIILYDQ